MIVDEVSEHALYSLAHILRWLFFLRDGQVKQRGWGGTVLRQVPWYPFRLGQTYADCLARRSCCKEFGACIPPLSNSDTGRRRKLLNGSRKREGRRPPNQRPGGSENAACAEKGAKKNKNRQEKGRRATREGISGLTMSCCQPGR